MSFFATLGLPLWADSDSITKKNVGAADGQSITLYTLSNAHGMSVSIMYFGARVVNLKVPDRDGKTADVVLGFDDLSGYPAKEKFSLDGQSYQLHSAWNHSMIPIRPTSQNFRRSS